MLMYRIDGKITLTEQDYYQAIYSNLEWHGEQDLEEFQRQAIHEVRSAVDNDEVKPFILSLKEALSFNAKKAISVAQGISYIDGDLAEEEQEILEYLENRVLAKSLYA
jgi:tellurite resistance protein